MQLRNKGMTLYRGNVKGLLFNFIQFVNEFVTEPRSIGVTKGRDLYYPYPQTKQGSLIKFLLLLLFCTLFENMVFRQPLQASFGILSTQCEMPGKILS